MKVSVYSATRAEAVEELTATRPSRPEIQKEAVNWRVSCFWVCQALAVPEECLPTTGQIWITCGSSEMFYFFFFFSPVLFKVKSAPQCESCGLGNLFSMADYLKKTTLTVTSPQKKYFFSKGAELHHNPSKNSHSATCSEHHLIACLQYGQWASVTGPLCRALTLFIWLWLYHMKEIIR